MTFSMKRFQAIVAKEWKDTLKNPQILLMAAMPVMFAFLFSKMDDGKDLSVMSFPILLALSMTGSFVQANMISEEKEKHTLRVLMLSPASTSEVLLSKSALTTLITFIVIVASVLGRHDHRARVAHRIRNEHHRTACPAYLRHGADVRSDVQAACNHGRSRLFADAAFYPCGRQAQSGRYGFRPVRPLHEYRNLDRAFACNLLLRVR
ncbi:ABC transporter permease [Paenibacillus sp. MBLB4367]|uniref:ABC transporter permease n=1 Tax=Paenibacillus sp. MBLB4367 TaxID=3384767 RepID=UPI0039084024